MRRACTSMLRACRAQTVWRSRQVRRLHACHSAARGINVTCVRGSRVLDRPRSPSHHAPTLIHICSWLRPVGTCIVVPDQLLVNHELRQHVVRHGDVHWCRRGQRRRNTGGLLRRGGSRRLLVRKHHLHHGRVRSCEHRRAGHDVRRREPVPPVVARRVGGVVRHWVRQCRGARRGGAAPPVSAHGFGDEACSPASRIRVLPFRAPRSECVAAVGGAYSERVHCNATHLVVSGHAGTMCDPANVLVERADPLGCSNGVLTVCAVTPTPTPSATPSAVPGPGYIATVSSVSSPPPGTITRGDGLRAGVITSRRSS